MNSNHVWVPQASQHTRLSQEALAGLFPAATGILKHLDGHMATQVINVTADAGASGISPITNTATVTAIGQIDPVAPNDSASIDITVGEDIAVTKNVDDSAPDEGDAIKYTVTVTNNGPNDATGVVVTDDLPAGVTFGSVDSVSQGAYSAVT